MDWFVQYHFEIPMLYMFYYRRYALVRVRVHACVHASIVLSMKCNIKIFCCGGIFVTSLRTLSSLWQNTTCFCWYCSVLHKDPPYCVNKQWVYHISKIHTYLQMAARLLGVPVREEELGFVNFYNRKPAWVQPTQQGCWETGGPSPNRGRERRGKRKFVSPHSQNFMRLLVIPSSSVNQDQKTKSLDCSWASNMTEGTRPLSTQSQLHLGPLHLSLTQLIP